MGIILGFFLLVYILVSIGIYKLTKRFSSKKWVHSSVLVILILIPTYDIIITNILGGYYCLTTPKTYIKQKVEYPLSIYWEDNVYPGFSTEDRKLMIINYLDGIHLKTMALNGDDGKVYVYKINARAISYQLLQTTYRKEHERLLSQIDYRNKSKEENENLIVKNKQALQKIDETINNYVDSILHTQEVYTKTFMPKMNYTVTFDEIRLNPLSRKFLYSDETKVIDNNTSEVIAYNRIYMPFFYYLAPDFALGNRYYDSWAWEICKSGSRLYYNGDGFQYIGFYASTEHAVYLNNKLYNKYIKGEQ